MLVRLGDWLTRARALLLRGGSSRVVSGFVVVAGLTVGGKALAFLKDAVVARGFGTSDAMDAYVLAFGFLSFVASVLGGGLPEAFLPHYAQLRHDRGGWRAQRLAMQGALVQAGLLLGIGLALWLMAPWVMGLAAAGFAPEKRALAVDLLRRLLPVMVLYGMTFQFSLWLRGDKRFALPAAAPMLIPVAILFALAFGATMEHLVTGTLWGCGLHLTVLVVAALRGLPRQARWWRSLIKLWEPTMRRVVHQALPYLMAGVVYSSAPVVDQIMAAGGLQAGAVAVLSYAEKLTGILLALTAMPAGEVLFPYFADTVARRDWVELRRRLARATLAVAGAAVPACLLLAALAPWVVRLLFERGAFTPEDTARVAAVLRVLVFQVPFYIVGMLGSRVLVSLQATRFILGLSVMSMALNAGLNAVLLRWMGAPGIALSTVMVTLISAVMVVTQVRRILARREAESVLAGGGGGANG
ncbi:MAG: polysaccharide biosynthesis C-terminal domain-containing protein [Verrucomicrobiales bacterium]|nr:polysaccharide biosynthesis C-terminal domain-containing protein [Verrucomicrobiales bacterium]